MGEGIWGIVFESSLELFVWFVLRGYVKNKFFYVELSYSYGFVCVLWSRLYVLDTGSGLVIVM